LDAAVPAKKKSAKVEITLKSATLPRRRTSKTEIQLGMCKLQGVLPFVINFKSMRVVQMNPICGAVSEYSQLQMITWLCA
jgi:hypothetical protein